MAVLVETIDAPDSTSTTYAMAPGDEFQGVIEARGSSDWVAFDVEAGRRYTFTLIGDEGDGGLGDPFLDVFNAESTLIAANDDSYGNLDSILTFTPDADATIYLAPRAFGGGPGGGYSLFADVDAIETEDAPSDASTPYLLRPGQTMTGNIGEPGDVDWIGIEMTGDRTVSLDLTGGNGERLFDPAFTLYDPNGNVINGDDDSGSGFDARALYTAPVDGIYYLAAAAVGGGSGFYSVAVSLLFQPKGGDWDDVLRGGSGADGLDGARGADSIYGGSGADRLRGGLGADHLFGDVGDDFLKGSWGADRLFGGVGDDILRGGAGADRLSGGVGDDFLRGGNGRDNLLGGAGSDTFDFSAKDGRNRIGDFDPAEDRVQIDLQLIGQRTLSPERIVARYAIETDDGLSLEFKDGTRMLFLNLDDPDALAASIQLV